ncbi:MAG TPA: proteasome activator, partial [Actinomycetota bacterium]|nr:proteasome activator [Actinomycetota bacterium]
REVLEEARKLGPEDSSVAELAALYQRVKEQLKMALPNFLFEELDQMELDLPFRDEATASEVRVVYSALIGWLGGLFQGLQASAQAQVQSQLPPSGELPDQEKPPEQTLPAEKEGYL